MNQSPFSEAYAEVQTGSGYRVCKNGVGIFTLPAFSACLGIDHGFSARTGGVSKGIFRSLNLSFSNEPERETVMQNYRIFCAAAGIPEASMVMDTYEHGATVRRVDRRDCGKGYTLPSLPACDALITDDPLVTLMTGHADCMAFFLYDPVHRAIGLAHAGWRGTRMRIGTRVAEAMQAAYGSDPREMHAGVGPSICGNCFEVDAALGDEFAAAFPGVPLRRDGRAGKAYVDLWMAAAKQLHEAGIPYANQSRMGLCTMEDERFYSYRRDGKTGGMTAFLRLK